MNLIKNFINKYKHVIIMTLSFLILDISLRYFTKDINFYRIDKLAPNLFTINWIFLMISVILLFKKKISKILYIISFSICLIMFLVHSVYFSYFKNFFDFSSLVFAGEAGAYLVDAIKASPLWIYITTFISITLAYLGIKFIPKEEKKFNYKFLLLIIPVFLITHALTPLCLGKAVSSWDAWRKPRNVYISFNDNNRSMQVAGFYEYNFRNFYVNFLKKEEKIEDENNILLEEKFKEDTSQYKNDYTGMFEGKNVIFVQLESIDKFLVTKEIMPTLHGLSKNSINFNNHFSFVSGGGSTFNSEYMVNTGYTTPITLNKGAYTFSKNNYSYSLPNLLKKEGYTVNAFHMNTPEYYSRNLNYKSFGYDSFNSLKQLDNGNYYTDDSYWLDTELINNPIFNEKIFNKDEKFASFIITYSAHMPFQANKGVCSLLVEDKTQELTEYECLKLQARETDNMLKLIIENLEEKELIDNTVLVLYADHYLYTLTDKTLLDEFKTTENNLINHTTWMIWSNKMKKKNVNDVTSQLNILPTVANLLGLEYHPNYYLMSDALADDYDGLVFFNDYSWYDGKRYVNAKGEVVKGLKADADYINYMGEKINTLIKKNDEVLKTNYFKQLKDRKKS